MKLIATKSYRYDTRRLQAGDEFEATNMHARILVGARKARYAPQQDEPELPRPVVVPEEKPEAEAEAKTREDDEINRLRAQAERLGIHIDGRWGVNRLQQEIAMAKL